MDLHSLLDSSDSGAASPGAHGSRWQPWRNWRWWMALVCVPLSWSVVLGWYEGSVPTLSSVFNVVALAFDFLLAMAFYTALLAGLPSLVVRFVQKRRGSPGRTRGSKRQVLAGVAALTVVSAIALIVIVSTQGGSQRELAACEAAQNYTDALDAVMNSTSRGEFSTRYERAVGEGRRFVAAAQRTENSTLAQRAAVAVEAMRDAADAAMAGDRAQAEQLSNEGDRAMSTVAAECEQLGGELDY